MRGTLEAIDQVNVPSDFSVEVIVVDNGSKDHTATLVMEWNPRQVQKRYLVENRPGQCYARNTGVSISNCDLILFTDDDIRPPIYWLEMMCRPIVNGEADAIAGRITIASHLERDWMTERHRSALAIRDGQNLPANLVGANMSFRRDVLLKVPFFDTELGPGALGFGDDSLFSRQLFQAGFRVVVGSKETEVVHHFDQSRLSYESFVETAIRRGRSKAYVAYHWLHNEPNFVRSRFFYRWLMLKLRRIILKSKQNRDGIAINEYLLIQRLSFLRFLMEIGNQPRNYTKRGLVKLIQNDVLAAK